MLMISHVLENKCRLMFLTRLLFMINDICLSMHFSYTHCILTLLQLLHKGELHPASSLDNGI